MPATGIGRCARLQAIGQSLWRKALTRKDPGEVLSSAQIQGRLVGADVGWPAVFHKCQHGTDFAGAEPPGEARHARCAIGRGGAADAVAHDRGQLGVGVPPSMSRHPKRRCRRRELGTSLHPHRRALGLQAVATGAFGGVEPCALMKRLDVVMRHRPSYANHYQAGSGGQGRHCGGDAEGEPSSATRRHWQDHWTRTCAGVARAACRKVSAPFRNSARCMP